jgi:hypothetical protein
LSARRQLPWLHHQYVSAIDVLTGTGLLAAAHLEAWKKGRVDFLERVIQGNLEKISLSLSMFRRWASEQGLKPSETGYVRRACSGTVDLRLPHSLCLPRTLGDQATTAHGEVK